MSAPLLSPASRPRAGQRAELDAVVSIAEQIGVNGGVYGCRMTGAGFGGCCVALVNAATVNSVSWDLADAYHTRTGIAATVFSSRPAAGATLVTADDTH